MEHEHLSIYYMLIGIDFKQIDMHNIDSFWIENTPKKIIS